MRPQPWLIIIIIEKNQLKILFIYNFAYFKIIIYYYITQLLNNYNSIFTFYFRSKLSQNSFFFAPPPLYLTSTITPTPPSNT